MIELKKIILREGIVQFRFEPELGKHYGFNIIGIIDKDMILLIDTGYEKHSSQVLQEMANMGLTLDSVIISHFHSDHIYGLKALPKAKIYGSSNASLTLNRWEDEEDQKYFLPDTLVEDKLRICFGSHTIDLVKSPGHAECSMLTVINNEYLHVGDEIMFSNKGEPLLPSIDREGAKRHIDSLEKLKQYKGLTFIPSHGVLLSEWGTISKDIENRLRYLESIASSYKKINYEQAVKDCDCNFLHS
jgi:glyoxylase-like metal-dependent hydrolase (beta-lactamase superfamily II)